MSHGDRHPHRAGESGAKGDGIYKVEYGGRDALKQTLIFPPLPIRRRTRREFVCSRKIYAIPFRKLCGRRIILRAEQLAAISASASPRA